MERKAGSAGLFALTISLSAGITICFTEIPVLARSHGYGECVDLGKIAKRAEIIRAVALAVKTVEECTCSLRRPQKVLKTNNLRCCSRLEVAVTGAQKSNRVTWLL
jgi:hypothetical protein